MIDELELVRRFREDVPGPDAAAEARARAVLASRVSAARPGHRRSRPWKAVAAVAIVAAMLSLPVVRPSGPPGAPVRPPSSGWWRGAEASAAEALERAAQVAATRPPSPAQASGGYFYTRSESAFLVTIAGREPVSALVPKVREIWIAPDGSGRLAEQQGAPVFFSDADRARWQAADRSTPPATNERFGPGGLHFADLASLPTDPNRLFEVVRERAARTQVPVPAEMFVLVGDYLRETTASPELRAALYRVAARIPGVELIGQTTDPAGRPGLAVAHTSDHSGFLQRRELVFDPSTSALLAERDVLLRRVSWLGAEPPAVIGYAAYLASGWVGSDSERPE